MARSVLFHKEGGPEVLEVTEVAIGEPGPGELRLRVEAIGVNRAEALYRAGVYTDRAEVFPAILGYTAAGVVEAVGLDVASFAPGDKVSTIPAFSMRSYGVYGEQAIVLASAVLHTPRGLDASEAVALWASFYGAIVEEGGVRPGDAVLITAASSGVGLAAIDIANHIGATPIAVTPTVAKRGRLLNKGAAHVIVTEEADVVERTLELTGGRGADFVFDAIAGKGVIELAKATAKDGALVLYGELGSRVTPYPMWIAPPMRIFRGFDLTMDEERLARAEAFIRAGVRAGTFRPVVDRTFDLADVAAAHCYLESNGQFGRVVVTVAS
ncbi:zinc-dependent alcohol dehydrogenase family protein [Streptomyces mirabilis]